MRRPILLALAVASWLAVAVPAFAQATPWMGDKYETKIVAEVIKVVPLENYSYIVFVNKGKNDGVKERTMALKYHIKTPDAEIGLIQNYAPIVFEDINASRFNRPFIAYFNAEPKYTCLFFWTYDEKIAAAAELAKKAGKTFADAKPKLGDKVEFVVSKPD